jgi:4-hydroxy-tetrahydrodipicolinate synthase
MAASGIGVYVGGGGSGEGYTLSEAETRRVLEVAADELGGRSPVRAMGVEPRTADAMVAYARLAGDAGLDAVQIYSLDPGHGHRPTAAEAERYLRTVLDATATNATATNATATNATATTTNATDATATAPTPIDAVVSTHQSVGYRLRPAFIAELFDDYGHLVGVNCTHPDLGYLAAVVDAVGGRGDVGGPAQGLAALALGAQGFLSSEANLAPRLAAAVIDRHDHGDLEGCLDGFGRLLRLSSALYGRGGIRVTKAVMARLGLPAGTVRPPQLAATDDDVEAILAMVEPKDL